MSADGGGGEFAAEATRWPTPTAGDSIGGNRNLPGSKANAGESLSDVVLAGSSETPRGDLDGSEAWQTPGVDSFRGRGGDRADEPGLSRQATQWPTPRTITGGPESAERKQQLGRVESGGSDLQAEAQRWPTPTGEDAENPGSRSQDSRPASDPLNRSAETWATPISSNAKGVTSSPDLDTARPQNKGNQLGRQALRWATPTTAGEAGFTRNDEKRAAIARGHEGNELGRQAEAFQDTPQPATTSTAGATSCESTRRSRPLLNARFSSLLMGWPPGLTSCVLSETEWIHWWQGSLSCLSWLVSTSGLTKQAELDLEPHGGA